MWGGSFAYTGNACIGNFVSKNVCEPTIADFRGGC